MCVSVYARAHVHMCVCGQNVELRERQEREEAGEMGILSINLLSVNLLSSPVSYHSFLCPFLRQA